MLFDSFRIGNISRATLYASIWPPGTISANITGPSSPTLFFDCSWIITANGTQPLSILLSGWRSALASLKLSVFDGDSVYSPTVIYLSKLQRVNGTTASASKVTLSGTSLLLVSYSVLPYNLPDSVNLALYNSYMISNVPPDTLTLSMFSSPCGNNCSSTASASSPRVCALTPGPASNARHHSPIRAPSPSNAPGPTPRVPSPPSPARPPPAPLSSSSPPQTLSSCAPFRTPRRPSAARTTQPPHSPTRSRTRAHRFSFWAASSHRSRARRPRRRSPNNSARRR